MGQARLMTDEVGEGNDVVALADDAVLLAGVR
jgi:hypothetical protein